MPPSPRADQLLSEQVWKGQKQSRVERAEIKTDLSATSRDFYLL